MWGMNERPNHFRRVPYAEFEGTHLFKVMRHFPELAKSMPEVLEMQKKMGRNWEDQKKPKKQKPREKAFRSTHALDLLKKSALLDNSTAHMDEIRKVLLISRNPQLADRFTNRPNALEALDSSLLDSQSQFNHHMPSNMMGNSPGGSLQSLTDAPGAMQAIQGDGTVGVLESTGNIKGPESYSVAATRSNMTKSRRGKTPLLVANEKLTKGALSYAPLGTMNVLSGFQGQDLDVEQLGIQLQRCLQITLHKNELEALFRDMDADNSGLIDGVEFTRYFLTLGNIARSKIAEEKTQKDIAEAKAAKDDAEREIREQKLWEASHVSDVASVQQEDEDRIFRKLAKVALYWDSGSQISAQKLVSFDCHLSPYQFKRQLELSLGLKCSPIDMAALLRRYKTFEGEYCVDGKAFLQSFSKLRRESAEEHKRVLKKFAVRKNKVRQMGQQETSYTTLGR
jgi:hypothetical protein